MPTRAPRQPTSAVADGELTHVDAAGRAHMVDVTAKPWTERRALARCRVYVGHPPDGKPTGTVGLGTTAGGIDWTELLAAARIAGIQAAKQTAGLIPLCHPLTVSDVEVRLWLARDHVDVEGAAAVTGPTGVEMEALTACAVAALTIVAAVGPTGHGVAIEDLDLREKRGGRWGAWVNPTDPWRPDQ